MQAPLLNDSLRKAIARAAGPIGIIGAVGGFIGDIIQPLGNFAPYVAAFSVAGAVLAFVWLVYERRRKGHEFYDTLAAGLFVLFVGSAIIFAIWSLIFAAGPHNGYLASNIEPVADIQARVLGIERNVGEIKQTTELTATRVAESSQVQVQQATRVAEGLTVQQAAATAQAQGFAGLQAQFASLQAGQALVQNPTTPQEWYSNARVYQLRGDTANAIQAYEGYLQFNLDYVDPYLEYTDLLKATEGIARTRERIDARYNARRDSTALDLVSARLLDSAADRLARYTALAARAPRFGPVFYELGLEYDRAVGVSPTADLLKKQGEAYSTLLKLEKEAQGYTGFFIDKALAEKNLAEATRRYEAFENARATIGKVDVQIYQYNDGVQILFILSESNAQKLLFSIDDPTPTHDTGKITVGDKTLVNQNITRVPLPVGEHTIYVQYIDANGTPSPVFSKTFRVNAVAVNVNQQPPDFSTNKIPVILGVAVVGAKIEDLFTYNYSIDSKALDQSQFGAGMAAITVPGLTPGDHVLYIQAVGADGKPTDLVEFPFTLK